MGHNAGQSTVRGELAFESAVLRFEVEALHGAICPGCPFSYCDAICDRMQLKALSDPLRDGLLTPTVLAAYHECPDRLILVLSYYIMTRFSQEFGIDRDSSELEAAQHFRMADFD